LCAEQEEEKKISDRTSSEAAAEGEKAGEEDGQTGDLEAGASRPWCQEHPRWSPRKVMDDGHACGENV